ncbi:MAG: hypothetical protein ACI934_000362 [Pseudohongiellaceae bacterium]|jgi:hypothetical protein
MNEEAELNTLHNEIAQQKKAREDEQARHKLELVDVTRKMQQERQRKHTHIKKAEKAEKQAKVGVMRIRRLTLELNKAQSYRYGSHTPGQGNWEKRWDQKSGRRVLLYALSDFSGSFFKWADAINRHTDYAARLVTFNLHPFGYSDDLLLPFPDLLERCDIDGLADEADIIHIKDETGFFTGKNRLPKDMFTNHRKPMVFTAYGGYMRKFADNPEFQDYVSTFDARIAMTPDLAYDWFNGNFIPHAIDTDLYPYTWTDGNLIAHSPSQKDRKGTDKLIDAMEGLDLEFDLIHGVSHGECMQRKQLCNLFFDQAGTEIENKMGISTVIGWYGNSALESAVFGIPTIAHLSEHAFAGARSAGRDIENKCAIINTSLGTEGIRKTLQEHLAMTPDDRKTLSMKTRKWMEDFHSYKACADELVKVYGSLLNLNVEQKADINNINLNL